MVICLERSADLHMAQPMPLPLTVSCFSKIQIGFTFLVPAYPGIVPDKGPLNGCVCVMLSAVGSDEPTRGVVHGLPEHLSLPAATRLVSQHDDGTRRDSASPGVTRQPDRHHTSTSSQRLHRRRSSQGRSSRSFHSFLQTNLRHQLSLASFRGRLIEYQLRLG